MRKKGCMVQGARFTEEKMRWIALYLVPWAVQRNEGRKGTDKRC
jgi:hypothetical protein